MITAGEEEVGNNAKKNAIEANGGRDNRDAKKRSSATIKSGRCGQARISPAMMPIPSKHRRILRAIAYRGSANATCVRKKDTAGYEHILARCTLDRSTFPFRS